MFQKRTYQCQTNLGNSEFSDSKTISEKSNNFFVNIGNNVESKIPQSSKTFREYLKNPVASSMFISPVSDDEVLGIN